MLTLTHKPADRVAIFVDGQPRGFIIIKKSSAGRVTLGYELDKAVDVQRERKAA